MLFHTHILIGIVLYLTIGEAFGGGNKILFFFLVLLGSILPDIDSANSKINRWSGIIGILVSIFAKHRGLFHSLAFHGVLFLIISSMWHNYYAWGLFLGYTAHVIGDGITLGGLKVFYPFSKFSLRGPIRVGGFTEGIIFLVLVMVIVVKIL